MSHQACSGNKRPREPNQVGDDLERETTKRSETHHVTNNITVVKASSSSTFQSYEPGRRGAAVIRRERPKSYPNSAGHHNVVGIEDDVEKLVQQLIHPQSLEFLGIVGMGGSGKTTLARQIYNHEKIKKYFDCRAWVCVSQVWSEESILKELFSQTTQQNSNNLPPIAMVQEMHELLKGKSYLVVLDDVWESVALRKIMLPICKQHGSKFVITTRNRQVIQFSNLRFAEHKPRPLSDAQSLDLFCDIAFDCQSNKIMAHRNGPFVDLAKKMLIKCEGLPLAVISLAGLLRTKKTIQEWIKVSKNVCSKIIEDYVGPIDSERVEDILELSYSDLNYTMKSCFMYLSLFPEDDKIECGMLMRCWIAEGFFKSVRLKRNESVEEVAREYLDELIQRCLVQVEKVNYAGFAKMIRVHDLLRDLALRKAEINCFSHTLPSNSSPRPIMQLLRLSCTDDRDREKILEDKVSRRLRSFIDFSKDDWLGFHLETLVTNYSVLRVLILTSREMNIPDAIGSLIHLRYLELFVFGFGCTPYLPDSIQNLRNLLSFKYEYFEDWKKPMPLPNLKQMKQLRYISLPWIKHMHTIYDYDGPIHLRDLPNLKVLKGMVPGEWMMRELEYLSPTVEILEICGIKSSVHLEKVFECPSIVEDNLRSLSLRCEGNCGEFKMQKLQCCKKLEKLYLKGFIGEITGVPLVLPPYLLKLHLEDSQIRDQDSFTNALKGLTYLKVLKLYDNAYVGVDLTFPANSLLNLETLELDSLRKVERIHVMEGAMPHLESFDPVSCDKLKMVRVMEGSLSNLKYLKNETEGVIVMLEIKTDKWMMKEFKDLDLDFDYLRIKGIKNKEQLEQVYEFKGIVKNRFHGLKLKLDTYDTEFELQKLQHCTQLEKLYLGGVIAATGAPYVFPPGLRKLELVGSQIGDQDLFADALQRLNCLRILILAYDAYVGAELTFRANSLLKLKTLELYHLRELERIHVKEGAMPHLKSFRVGHCKNFKVIPQRFSDLLRRIDDDEEDRYDISYESVYG